MPALSLFAKLSRRMGLLPLSTQVLAVWLLVRHPATPRAARWLAWAVLAYLVSPIDLIPDFIPVLGQLDDLLLVPLGVALVVRLTPAPLWQACLAQAQATTARLPRLWWGAAIVLLTWAVLMLALLAGGLWAVGAAL